MPAPPGYVAPDSSAQPWDHGIWPLRGEEGADIVRQLSKVSVNPQLVHGAEIDVIARELWLDIQGLDVDRGAALFKVAREASLAAMLPWSRTWHPAGFLDVVRKVGLYAVLVDDPRTRGAALTLTGKAVAEARDQAEIASRLAKAMPEACLPLDERNLALIDEMLQGPVADQLRLEFQSAQGDAS